MKQVKNITIALLVFIIIGQFIYAYILRIEVIQIRTGFDDCYKLMNYYADSLEVQQNRFEKAIEELQQ